MRSQPVDVGHVLDGQSPGKGTPMRYPLASTGFPGGRIHPTISFASIEPGHGTGGTGLENGRAGSPSGYSTASRRSHGSCPEPPRIDRKSVVSGKSVDLGG